MFTSCIPFLNLLLPPSTNQALQIARYRNSMSSSNNENEKGGEPSMLHGHAAYVAGAAKVSFCFCLRSTCACCHIHWGARDLGQQNRTAPNRYGLIASSLVAFRRHPGASTLRPPPSTPPLRLPSPSFYAHPTPSMPSHSFIFTSTI